MNNFNLARVKVNVRLATSYSFIIRRKINIEFLSSKLILGQEKTGFRRKYLSVSAWINPFNFF
jgi:hypothetical protein